MQFINDLIKANQAAAPHKKGRWAVIAEAYITLHPNTCLPQMLKGLELHETSSAWSSCKAAVRKLVNERKLVKRFAGNRRYNYTINPEAWLFGHK